MRVPARLDRAQGRSAARAPARGCAGRSSARRGRALAVVP